MLETNKIYNVDCLDGLSAVEDKTIDIVVTSPPYYNAREYAIWPSYQDYLDFINDVVCECERVLKPGGFICWNVSPRIVVDNKKYSLGFDSQRILEGHFIYYDNLVWLKPKGGYRLSFAETKWQSMCKKGDRPARLMPRYENIFIYSKDDPFTSRVMVEPEEHDFWYWGNVCELPVDHLPGHHGVFPIELPKRMINWFCTAKNGVVLDPFMGSGTTAIASKLLGHQFIGFELHQEYIDYYNTWEEKNAKDGELSRP